MWEFIHPSPPSSSSISFTLSLSLNSFSFQDRFSSSPRLPVSSAHFYCLFSLVLYWFWWCFLPFFFPFCPLVPLPQVFLVQDPPPSQLLFPIFASFILLFLAMKEKEGTSSSSEKTWEEKTDQSPFLSLEIIPSSSSSSLCLLLLSFDDSWIYREADRKAREIDIPGFIYGFSLCVDPVVSARLDPLSSLNPKNGWWEKRQDE